MPVSRDMEIVLLDEPPSKKIKTTHDTESNSDQSRVEPRGKSTIYIDLTGDEDTNVHAHRLTESPVTTSHNAVARSNLSQGIEHGGYISEYTPVRHLLRFGNELFQRFIFSTE